MCADVGAIPMALTSLGYRSKRVNCFQGSRTFCFPFLQHTLRVFQISFYKPIQPDSSIQASSPKGRECKSILHLRGLKYTGSVSRILLYTRLPSTAGLKYLSHDFTYSQEVPVVVTGRYQRQSNWHAIRTGEPRNIDNRGVKCLSYRVSKPGSRHKTLDLVI